jgi:uroporphyrinogen-III synthase
LQTRSAMRTKTVSILSTRPLNPRLVADAALKAINIDEIAFIRTVPVQSKSIYSQIQGASLRPATVIFTSMNAADAVIGSLKGTRPRWEIFCVGKSTREQLSGFFGAASIAGTAANARELASLIASQDGIKEVIFFCGDQRREELPVILKDHNIHVQELVVYQTIHLHNEVGPYEGILFFSPSAVESFFSVNKPLASTVYFAIGETTAAAVRLHTTSHIVVANEPGAEELVKLAIEYFS